MLATVNRRSITLTLLAIACVLAACGGPRQATGEPSRAATPTASDEAPTTSPPAANSPSAATAAATMTSECSGVDVDWSALPEVPAAYGRAWNEDDAATRMELLDTAFAERGSYADPTTDGRVEGRVAFNEHLGIFRAGWAGSYFEPRAWITSDQHHGYVQMRWRLCDADDVKLFDGVDFGELSADGRLERVTGFFAMDAETPRAVCVAPAGDWSGIPEIARDWAAAAVKDSATRAALIAEIWASDGFYVDPSDVAPVVGHSAIAERVGGMLWDGAFFEAAAWGPGDDHHGYMRLRWRLCDGTESGLEGTDYVAVDADGKFDRVVGFFPWP